LKKTLFQLFATVHVLHAHGLCHGDLYARTNIMMRKLDVAKTLAYAIDGKHYRVPDVKWMVTIIDFDLAERKADCNDYDVVVESIQVARKIPIEFPKTLAEAITLFGAPYLMASGGSFTRKRKSRKLRKTRKIQ
jgi:hypothetical protein